MNKKLGGLLTNLGGRLIIFLIKIGFQVLVTNPKPNVPCSHSFCVKDASISNVLKGLLTLSTALLLVGVAYFHLVDYYLLNWRTEFTASRLGHLALELLLFSVHPVPGQFTYTSLVVPNNGESAKVSGRSC